MRTCLSSVLTFILATACAPTVPDGTDVEPDPSLDCVRGGDIAVPVPRELAGDEVLSVTMPVVERESIWLYAMLNSHDPPRKEDWIGVLDCTRTEPVVVWTGSGGRTAVSSRPGQVLVGRAPRLDDGSSGLAHHQAFTLAGEPIGDPVPFGGQRHVLHWRWTGERWHGLSHRPDPDTAQVYLSGLDEDARDLGRLETWDVRSRWQSGPWFGGPDGEVRWYEADDDGTRLVAGLPGGETEVLLDLPEPGTGRGDPGTDWSVFRENSGRYWLVHVDGRMKPIAAYPDDRRLAFDEDGHWGAQLHRVEWLPEASTEPIVLFTDDELELAVIAPLGDRLAAGLWVPRPGRRGDAVIRFHRR